MKCGPIPTHVAFIMDGNRRYAGKCGYEDVIVGHQHGFDRLTKVFMNLLFIKNFQKY